MRRLHAADRRVTYAEMLEWPDDGRQYELYDGEVMVVPAPFPGHQRVTSNVADLLRDYAKTTGGLALVHRSTSCCRSTTSSSPMSRSSRASGVTS